MGRKTQKHKTSQQAAIETGPRFSQPIICATVFLVSCSMLAFEVSLTRICSVLFYYHISFAIISCALLCLGLGGFVGYFLVDKKSTQIVPFAAIGVAAFSPCMLLVTMCLVKLPITQTWFVIIPLLAPPFLVVGIFQSLVFRAFSEKAELIYAADLCGGSCGAMLSVVLINFLNGPINTAIALSVLAAGGAWLFSFGCACLMPPVLKRLLLKAAFTCCALAVSIAVIQYSSGFFEIDFTRVPGKLISKILQPTRAGVPRLLPSLSQWDSTSRVDVLEEPDLCRPTTVQRTIFIDGEVPSAIVPISAVWAPHNCTLPIKNTLPALPYRLFSPNSVLCIGAGGGYDVVMARLFGANKIDALELSAGVLTVVAKSREFTGDVYGQSGVSAVNAEGRQFVRRAAEASYDMVVMALAQSLVSNLAEYALSENYLYTREAFCDYLRVLQPGGVLVVTLNNNKLLLRLEATVRQELDRLGYPGRKCIIALNSKNDYPYDHILVVKKGAFTMHERIEIDAQIKRYCYKVVDVSGRLRAEKQQKNSSWFGGDALYTLPATDDRPFFFHITPVLPPGLSLLLSASFLILVTFFVAFILLHVQKHSALLPVVRQAGYFMCLGTAFMMIEVLVLQKTIFIIGFPTLNLAVILAVFLLAAGLGSKVGGAVLRDNIRQRLPLLVLILGISIAFLIPLIEVLKNHVASFPLSFRCMATGSMIFPFAFFMGIPFPLAIKLLPKKQSAVVPWLWGLNGIASILGSAVAVTLVLYLGYRISSLLPAALYCLAAVLAHWFNRSE